MIGVGDGYWQLTELILEYKRRIHASSWYAKYGIAIRLRAQTFDMKLLSVYMQKIFCGSMAHLYMAFLNWIFPTEDQNTTWSKGEFIADQGYGGGKTSVL